jgi:hypothetical protein
VEAAAVLDHDNLEEFADPADYDRADPVDTGVAFYSALALPPVRTNIPPSASSLFN